MYKTIVAAAALPLTGASVSLAQAPPGITREMIERALPLEGAPLAEPGLYKVTSEGAFGSPFPKKDTLGCAVEGDQVG